MATERRAILFTDIVGYSRMMSSDEKLALNLLAEHDKILNSKIRDAGGKVIKNIGDAFFAEFDSPGDAISASIEFQKNLSRRNKLKEKKERIWVRAGVHFGDMLRRDNDLFGHDVNICARLESIAPEGGIVVSQEALASMGDGFLSREIGYLKLKNINDPVQAFRVYLDQGDLDSQSQGQLHDDFEHRGVPIVDIDSYQTREIFSTAFLYPKDLTTEHDFVCYGLAEGLISDFQKIDRVRTPGMADITKLKDSDLDSAKAAQILQVESVIESTIANDKKGIVVSMRMFDSGSGEHTWSGEWRQSSSDLRLIRGEIIRDLLSHYQMDTPDQILKYLEREFTSNPDAMRCFYDGMRLINLAHESKDFENARALFIKALGHDDRFVEARAQLGVTYMKLGFREDSERELDEAMSVARSEKYEQSQSYVSYLIGIMNQECYKEKKAIRYFERALALQVQIEDKLSQAKTLNALAGCYSNISEVDRAQELLEQSIEIRKGLEESDSLAYPYATMANIALSRNDYSDSIRYFKSAHALFKKQGNDYFGSRIEWYLALDLIELGRYNQAKCYIDAARPVCEEFDDPLGIGQLHYLDGRICSHQDNHGDAIEHYRKANNIYGDLILNSIEVTSDLIYSLINIGKLDEAGVEVKNLVKLNKRINEKDKLLSKDIICAYHGSCSGETDAKEIDNLIKQLDEFETEGNINPNLEFWMLSQCYMNTGDTGKAKKIQEETIERIRIDSEANSNPEDRSRYINNGLHQQISAPLRAYSIEDEKTQVQCPGCRKQIQPGFSFCPVCGSKV
jgi:class 3 adenylate cyclase/TolB-like protein/Tfp pilus assembly protein PilF